MTAHTARADGVVLPPADVVARYRARGLWGDGLLHELVMRHAARRRDAVALVCDRQRISYGHLAAAVDLAASRLWSAGLRRHDRVLLQLPNSAELVTTMLALIQLGARPVLTLPSLREREIRHVGELSKPHAYVLHAPVRSSYALESARKLHAEQPWLDHLIVLGRVPLGDGEIDLAAICLPGGCVPPAAVAADSTIPGNRIPSSPGSHGRLRDGTDHPGDVALYLLSAGTTGLPKPIPRTHRDYVCNVHVCSEVCPVGEQTVYLAALPMVHNFALGCPGVLGVLAAGGRVVIGRPDPAEDALALIERERVTLTSLVPSLALQLAAAVPAARRDLSSLRVIQVGGARLSAQHADQVRDALGCQVQQVYGMSEGVINCTRLDDPWDVIRQTQGRPASAADEWRIVDESGADVAAGQSGELLVRGPYTIGGYLAPPPVNENAFDADGYYHTGDAVRLHQTGNFVVEGRRRDFVNVMGEKVSAAELEELLAGHPAIAQCAVVPVPDALTGEAICLYATVRADTGLTLQEVRAFLNRAGVARFKLPERLEIVSAMPVTGMGKLDRTALRKRCGNHTMAAKDL